MITIVIIIDTLIVITVAIMIILKFMIKFISINIITVIITNGSNKSILIFSKWEAIQAQFLTAIAAFLGTFVGLYAHKNEFLETIMIAVTSGGFIYIATVTIMPLVIAQKSSLLQTVLESIAFLIGVGFMVAVAVLEEVHE